MGAICAASAGIGCAVGVGLIAGAALGVADYHFSNSDHSLSGYARAAAVGGLQGALNGALGYGRAWTVGRAAKRFGDRKLRYEARYGEHALGKANQVRSYMGSAAFTRNMSRAAKLEYWERKMKY